MIFPCRSYGGTASRRAARLLAVTLLGAAMACGDEPSGPGSGTESRPELLFFSDRASDPSWAMFRMSDDGSGVQLYGGAPTWAPFLDVAPDGRRLVFGNERAQLMAVNVDGTANVKLTNRQGTGEDRSNAWPHWSPDGAFIAFSSNRDERRVGTTGGLYDAWVMRADGSEPRKLSGAVEDTVGLPAQVLGWTPQGRVVFEIAGFKGGVMHRAIYSVNPDGTDLRRQFERSDIRDPAWSPDGSKIAFISDRDGRERLYVMNADGSGERLLTDHAGRDELPREVRSPNRITYDPWSPDGRMIAYTQYGMIENGVIYVVAADGAWRRRLTGNDSWFNGWSPAGDRIAFNAVEDGAFQRDVFVIGADGTGLQNLTNHPSDDLDAIWLPGR